jgi:hypothetical protein
MKLVTKYIINEGFCETEGIIIYSCVNVWRLERVAKLLLACWARSGDVMCFL